MEYDTTYVTIPWAWTKGTVVAKNPKEVLDTASLSQLRATTGFVPIKTSEVDTVVASVVEGPQTVQTDSTTEAGAAFGGPVTGGYTAAFHQSWEFPIPSLWRQFSHDTVYITVDAVITFSESSQKPDQRLLNDWVWEIDVADVLTNAIPISTHFRYIDRGVYRVVMKAAGLLLGGAHKIRFGFNFKTLWFTGQPETTEWMGTVRLAAHAITNALVGRQVSISEESGPSNLTSSFERLELFTSDAEDSDDHNHTMCATL